MELIENFAEEYSNETGIDKDKIIFICNNIFNFVKKEISSGNMNCIRIKYFGLFKPSYKKYKIYFEKMQEKYYNNQITKEEYEKVEKNFSNFIKSV